MSEKREFPILKGKLLSDLDANGYKILGAKLEVPPEAIKEAIGELLSAKADKSVVDELNKSVASVTTETQRLARDSRAKDDLAVYGFSGGTTEYYLADKFLPVTGPEMYDFSKITFAPGISAGIETIQVFDANGFHFGSFRADTLGWFVGDVVSFGGKNPETVTLSSRFVGGSLEVTGAKLLTSDEVVTPSSSARPGQAAAAKGVYDNFKRKQSAKSSPNVNGKSTSFIDKISQDAQGVITATKKSIPNAGVGSAGVVCLYGANVLDFESGNCDWAKDRRLFGEILSDDFGAASNHALMYTTLGHVRFFYLDPYEDNSRVCYVYPSPFCHDICYMPYAAPDAVLFKFNNTTGGPWQQLSSRTWGPDEWSGSKKAIVEIDAFDISDRVQLHLYDSNDDRLAVTGMAYGECGKDDWNVITPGVINRFYLEMNYNRLTIIKYAFPQYLYEYGSASYWSSYYSSYWSSYYSSYWSSYWSS